MKSRISVLMAAVLLFANAAALADASEAYLVMFKGNGVPADFAENVADLGGTVIYSHDVGFAVVDGIDDSAAASLGQRHDVSEVQQDEAFEIGSISAGEAMQAPAADGEAVSHDTDSSEYGNARWYPYQWNLPAVSADQAWEAGRFGSADVTVAVLDTGIDYSNPDLYGLVDLSRSASFVPYDDMLVSYYFPFSHPVTDLNWHGTHVAATIASNGILAEGVTRNTTLIGVKVCDYTSRCAFGSILAGLLHAVDAGADVANMSLGGAFHKAGNGRLLGFIHKVWNYARQQGMTVVVAAHNQADDMDHDGNLYRNYCTTPSTICVSATGPTSGGYYGPWENIDAPADYTNFGRSAINVAAPGGGGWNAGTWVIAACSQTSLVYWVCQEGGYVVGAAGTSMSAPHVSALAALLVEEVGRNPSQIRSRIQNGADDLGQPGTDPYYGKGRINIINTIQ